MAGGKILEECLFELGIQSVLYHLKEKNVDADMIESLSDADLTRLDVDSIGHRHRLCQMVKTNFTEKVLVQDEVLLVYMYVVVVPIYRPFPPFQDNPVMPSTKM